MSLQKFACSTAGIEGAMAARSAEGEGELPLYLLTPGLLLGVLVMLLVLIAVLGLVGWRVSRRVRASAARATFQRGALALRAAASPVGPRRELARLRGSLHDNLVSTTRVVAAAPAGQLGELLGQLQAAGAELDRQLRVLADDPADIFVTEMLPGLTTRVARLNDDALSLRRSAFELTEDPGIRRGTEQDLRDRISGLAEGLRELRGPAEPMSAPWSVAPATPLSHKPGPLPRTPPPPDPHRTAQPPADGRTGPTRSHGTERGHST